MVRRYLDHRTMLFVESYRALTGTVQATAFKGHASSGESSCIAFLQLTMVMDLTSTDF